MAGKASQFSSSKINANPPSQKFRKISSPSSAENLIDTKQKQ